MDSPIRGAIGRCRRRLRPRRRRSESRLRQPRSRRLRRGSGSPRARLSAAAPGFPAGPASSADQRRVIPPCWRFPPITRGIAHRGTISLLAGRFMAIVGEFPVSSDRFPTPPGGCQKERRVTAAHGEIPPGTVEVSPAPASICLLDATSPRAWGVWAERRGSLARARFRPRFTHHNICRRSEARAGQHSARNALSMARLALRGARLPGAAARLASHAARAATEPSLAGDLPARAVNGVARAVNGLHVQPATLHFLPSARTSGHSGRRVVLSLRTHALRPITSPGSATRPAFCPSRNTDRSSRTAIHPHA